MTAVKNAFLSAVSIFVTGCVPKRNEAPLKIKIAFAMLIFCLCHISAYAQETDRDFTLEAPDSVEVGDTFTLRYTLDTRNLQRYMTPSFDGFDFIDMDYEIIKDISADPYVARYTFIYRLRASGIGLLPIQPMKVVHQGKEVMSETAEIKVLPDARHKFVADALRTFLQEHGFDPDTSEVRFIYDCPEFSIASSVRSHYFAAIAYEEYASSLSSPLLAYGLEYGIPSLESEFPDILNYYRKQLQYISKNAYVPFVSGGSVPALLEDIAWGQGEPYNSECPVVTEDGLTVNAVAGCGPVAIGQIMKYFGFPDADDPASLLVRIGSATETRYGAYATSSHSGSYRNAMIDSLGFSPQCRLLALSQEKLIEKSLDEISDGRPVLVMNESHAFVCDGYEDDFLHFNMGWGGPGNGWYRVLNAPVSERKDMLFHSMISGLSPDVYIGSCKSVALDKRKRLKDVLTESEMENLHSLTISGSLTGEDIRLIRRMAGAADDDSVQWIGSLQHLDLSDAEFTNDEDSPYLSADAAEARLKVWREIPVMRFGMAPRMERVEYDFTFMTEDQWEEILRYRMHKGNGYRIVCDQGRYMIEYLMEKRKVGPNMFSNCINLKTLELPSDIIEVSQDAFRNTAVSR